VPPSVALENIALNRGATIAIMIPMMVSTTANSKNVNPFLRRGMKTT